MHVTVPATTNTSRVQFMKMNQAKRAKNFSHFIKHKRTDVSAGVSPLLDRNGIVQTDDKILAEILNDQFGSVFPPMTTFHPRLKAQQIQISMTSYLQPKELKNF